MQLTFGTCSPLGLDVDFGPLVSVACPICEHVAGVLWGQNLYECHVFMTYEAWETPMMGIKAASS